MRRRTLNFEYFAKYANDIGIPPRHQEICYKCLCESKTYEMLSQEMGLSRGRIYQIIKKCENEINEYCGYLEIRDTGLSSDYEYLLSDSERPIFNSFFRDQLPYTRIANIYKVRPERVKQIIRRCILKIDGEIGDKAAHNRQVGERLRALRKNRHLTLEQYALKMGISPRTARRYEHGQSRLPDRLVKAVSAFFEVTPLFILEGKNKS